uniref:Beta-1,4-galactosyltransferase n=2 Tax=Latimeria chalumnae TaxID=7897 RepID=H2ZY98_LATCH
MGLFVSRKLKVLLFVGSCMVMLTWISVYSTMRVPKLQEFTQRLQSLEHFTTYEREKESKTMKRTSLIVPALQHVVQRSTNETQQLCPYLSPYLQGVQQLSFSSMLTLEDIQKENPNVLLGRYQPLECHALQKVAILIPFRNREKHLVYLLKHLHPFLQRQQVHYGIYVINQAGNAIFNRAKLLNIGYIEALKDYNWDCFIFHDVDLVPENDFNLYLCDNQPKHLVVARNSTGYRLRYKGYFGGVTALTKQQFSSVNGFPNNYWGWGGEDDDLRKRVELQKMKVVRPPIEIARYTMIFHNRDSGNEENAQR